MAPPGTKCYIHIKPHKRALWGFHTKDVWCVGPAMNHYRCYTVVMKEKATQCITDTIKFKHHGNSQSSKDLTTAVRNNPTEGPPDYIEAVQWLRAVLLKEKQQKYPVPPASQEKTKEVPRHNQIQALTQPVALKAPMPTNEVPTQYPALNLCEEDEIDMTEVD
eukprot:8472925-Ditylum_brightwellii.AAC.1